MHPSYLLAWGLPIAAAESCYSVIAKTHTFTSTITTVQFTTLPNEGCPVSTAHPSTLVPADDASLPPTNIAEPPISTIEAQPYESASQSVGADSPSSSGHLESSAPSVVPVPIANPTVTTAITPSVVNTIPSNGATDGVPKAPIVSSDSPYVRPSIITTAITPSLVNPKPSNVLDVKPGEVASAIPTEVPSIITTAITPSLVNPKPSNVLDVKPSVVPGEIASEIPTAAQPIMTAITPSAIKPVPTKLYTSVEPPIISNVGPTAIATGAAKTITTAITPSAVKIIPSQSVARLLPSENAAIVAASEVPFADSAIPGEDSFDESSLIESTVHI